MWMSFYAMSERYRHLILPRSSHSTFALRLRSYLRMLCAHTTYRAIFAATVPLRVLLSHTTIEHYFRMLVSQDIFACHVRTLASALFLFRRYCCALFKITHAIFACQFRTCSAYNMFACNCRKLFLGCSCRMLLSHAMFACSFAYYFPNDMYIPKLIAHATLARSVRTPFTLAIPVSQTLSPPSASNLRPIL